MLVLGYGHAAIIICSLCMYFPPTPLTHLPLSSPLAYLPLPSPLTHLQLSPLLTASTPTLPPTHSPPHHPSTAPPIRLLNAPPYPHHPHSPDRPTRPPPRPPRRAQARGHHPSAPGRVPHRTLRLLPLPERRLVFPGLRASV